MAVTTLWNHDEPITSYTDDIHIPRWIEQDISPADIAAIVQGGCASGAYMPGVTYHVAAETMQTHGDTADGVLNYIISALGDLPTQPADEMSWSGLACLYVSCAVELWASETADRLMSLLDDATEERT